MPKPPSKRLVIDASVARAAGSPDSPHPRSKCCRDLLFLVYSVCHQMVITTPILEEWQEHESREANKWRRVMTVKGNKVVDLKDISDLKFRKTVLSFLNADEHEAALKDLPLIEAALRTDSIIISLDQKAIRRFQKVASRLPTLKQITWINPEKDPRQAIEWLRAGAG